MGHKHNRLNDTIFRNSKYMEVVNTQVGCKEFKNFCEDKNNKEYKGQYDFMLDTFKTLILLNNCFYSDSNLSVADKVANALDIMEAYLYIDTDKKKYSVRFIQGIIEKHSTHLYRVIGEWYLTLEHLTTKDISTTNYVKNIMEEIENEMTRLENVDFDDMVKGSIDYTKRDSNYKMFISRFDTLNTELNNFVEAYRNDYNEWNTDTPLSDEDLTNIGLIYTLVAKACNGIIKTLENGKEKEYSLNENTPPQKVYEAYLDSLNISVDDVFYNLSAEAFYIGFMRVYSNSGGLSLNEVINNYDMLFFLNKMRGNTDNLITTDDEANKVLKKLRQVYEIITKKPTSQEDMLDNFKVGYDMILKIIAKYQGYYIRVS